MNEQIFQMKQFEHEVVQMRELLQMRQNEIEDVTLCEKARIFFYIVEEPVQQVRAGVPPVPQRRDRDARDGIEE